MRNFYIGILALCLGLLSIHAQADDKGLTNNPNLLTLDNLVPTNTPNMTLLKGVVLVAKYTALDKVSPTDFFSGGSGFIVGQYLGSDNLNYVNSPILIEDLSTVQTIRNISFFAQFDPNKTGVLSEKTIRQAQLVLMYYNSNGYPLMRSMANYGIHQLAYDLTSNSVKLNLYDAQAHEVNLNLSPDQTKQAQAILNNPAMNKYLMAELVNFGANPSVTTSQSPSANPGSKPSPGANPSVNPNPNPNPKT